MCVCVSRGKDLDWLVENGTQTVPFALLSYSLGDVYSHRDFRPSHPYHLLPSAQKVGAEGPRAFAFKIHGLEVSGVEWGIQQTIRASRES